MPDYSVIDLIKQIKKLLTLVEGVDLPNKVKEKIEEIKICMEIVES